MSVLIFRGGETLAALPPDDRGLAYGDGLFETLLAVGGEAPWWPAHWRRLAYGAQRLGIALPDEARIHQAARGLLGAAPQVLKIILTRGGSGRGYLPGNGPSTCLLSVHPLPAALPRPLALHWCTTRVARQPALAGLKHLNRLENVLARAECEAAGFAEGLMCDADGDVIGATAANVFIHADGVWLTPELSGAGIAGIARARVLDTLPEARVGRVRRDTLENADAVFLCNAVRGMMAVGGVGATVFPERHPALCALQARFAAANPFFPDR